MSKAVRINLDTQTTLPLDWLEPLQGELKRISEKNKEKLKKSILKHGFSYPFFVWEDVKENKIYILDGHQRRIVLMEMKNDGYSIPQLPVVFIQAYDINDAKNKLLSVASQFGEFTESGVANFLQDFDFDIETFDIPFLEFSNIVDADQNEDEDEQITIVSEHERTVSPKEAKEIKDVYSGKIDAPIYKPSMEKPPSVFDLYNKEKTNEVIEKIKKNYNIDLDTKAFLVEAAHRFTSFRYDLIAEFYAHSNKEVQELMESLALIIIDFDKAVEGGFVTLSEELNEILKKNLNKE